MKHSDILLHHKIVFAKDAMSDFIGNLTFITNNFGHHEYNIYANCNERIIGDFEILYFLDGKGCISVHDRQYECSAGDLVLIPPFIKHDIKTSPTDPYNNYWIHFDIHPLYRHTDFISAMLPFNENKMNIGIDEKAVFLFRLLESELKEKRPGYLSFLNTILMQIITLFMRAVNTASINPDLIINESRHSVEKTIIDKSVEYIYSNLSNTICIRDICNRLYISEAYLYKCFRKVLNLPPNQVILLVKIKHAEQLIKTSSMSFKEISEVLGFCSPYYFSSVFKKFYNVSPREYANSVF